MGIKARHFRRIKRLAFLNIKLGRTPKPNQNLLMAKKFSTMGEGPLGSGKIEGINSRKDF